MRDHIVDINKMMVQKKGATYVLLSYFIGCLFYGTMFKAVIPPVVVL